jgi:hypothetical protein
MKIKLLFFLAVLLGTGGSLSAQQSLPISSGTINVDVSQTQSFKVLVNQAVTAINVSSDQTPAGGTLLTIIFTQDASGGHAVSGWSYAGGGFTSSCTVSTTANATTVCQFQYDATSNSWFSVSGGGGGSGGGCSGPGCIDAGSSTYGIKADTKFVQDATWSSGANPVTVTITASDPPFASTDTGKACFGHITTNLIPLGTFTFIDATHGTCSTTSTGAATGNGIFVWGTNDTTAVLAAASALYALGNCGKIVWPAGMIMVQKGILSDKTGPATCKNAESQFATGWEIDGQGIGVTIFVPTPNFDFTTCNSNGCFFSPASPGFINTIWKDFSINGLNQTFSGISTSPATSIATVGGDSYLYNVGFNHWLTSATGLSTGVAFNGQGDIAVNLQVDAFGGNGVSQVVCGGPNIAFYDSYSADPVTGAIAFQVTSSGICYGHANQWWGASRSVLVNGGVYVGNADYPLDSGSNVHIQVQSGGRAVLQGWGYNSASAGCAAPAATVWGINFGSGGGTVSASGSCLTGGSTNGAINATGAAGTFIDLGGNKFIGPILNTGTNLTYSTQGGESIKGVCTGTASAASTLGLYGTGSNVTASTCTSTTLGAGKIMTSAGTLQSLIVTAGTGGVNASSGVFTVLKNGSTTTMTCTTGTATSCSDTTHTVAYAAGDLISIQFTTQAAETLANIKATVVVTN